MKRPPEPRSSDISAWRRMVREARKAAADPAASVGDLEAAEKVARRSIVVGVLSRENLCVRLVVAARQFVADTARGRREGAAALAELAGEVEQLLPGARPSDPAAADAPPQRRPLPFRADLDG